MASNERKRRYAEARERGLNQKEAAIDAGYAPKHAEKTGNRLEGDPDVIAHREMIRNPPAPDNFEDPEDLFRSVMNDPTQEMKVRMDAAMKLHQVQGGTPGGGKQKLGKKDQQAQQAQEAGHGKFAPGAPPKLQAVN